MSDPTHETYDGKRISRLAEIMATGADARPKEEDLMDDLDRSDLPITDVDDYTLYEWQRSSAVRPEYPAVRLFREVYFGRTCLAEPAGGCTQGPPFVVCTYPTPFQDEVCLEFSHDAAEKAVKRHDKRRYDEEMTIEIPF
jgi:hypothetical protein